jgi:ABC-2 type transport system permease protein
VSSGLLWLTGRETLRVLKVWTQTIAAPVISSFLFILVFGLSLGGAVRALAIGVALLGLSLTVTDVPVREPLALVAAITLALVLFSSLGVVVGIYAETFDHHTFVNNLVILPLTFLGGVFYSVDSLPDPWHAISHLNPIFYLVEAVRYGFLGQSDVSVALSLGITGALAAAAVAWSSWLFATGRRLKA